MNTDAYVFVEVARGNPDGSFSRNKVLRHEDYQPNGHPDSFSSYMLFDESLAEHIMEQGEKNGWPSVKGYRGPALPQKVIADFDSEDNLEQARKNALHYVRRAAHRFGIPEGYFAVFFSGRKGFSVEIPAAAFGGFDPHPLAAHYVGYVARKLAGGADFPTFDDGIYDVVTRLWRLPNTRHGESGL